MKNSRRLARRMIVAGKDTYIMIAIRPRELLHFTVRSRSLKLLLGLALLAPATLAQQSGAVGRPDLRAELTALIAAGKPEQAVRRAQQALQAGPNDADVRREYVELHLALAQTWLAQRRFEAAGAALAAIRAVQPEHAPAARLLVELEAARERAGRQAQEIDRFLQLELFETALDRIKEVQALRPDLAETLQDRARAGWLGAADDHYLARNFPEAFALYESLLANDPQASARIHSRWAVSLALALAESDFSARTDPNAAGRLLARAIDVLRKTREPILGQIIGGLLAERAGSLVDAGRTYAQALGRRWELPPVDRRQEVVSRLRQAAVRSARQLYRETPVQRRDGFWAIALPATWKHRRTPHCDVYARNDLIAERVVEAAEFHLAGVAEWLGAQLPSVWEPRCEIRVHATREELHSATGTHGITFAVSHTRLQGERVLLRKLDVFQADPWLLSSTLPHELTHLLIADLCKPAAPPLTLDEGLALHAEPPARRLMYRRLLADRTPDATALLSTRQLPTDVEGFYAEAGALAGWLLHHTPAPQAETLPRSAARELLDLLAPVPTEWWRPFGWAGQAEADAAWSAWYAARRDPHRMPLMILVEPAPEHRKQID